MRILCFAFILIINNCLFAYSDTFAKVDPHYATAVQRLYQLPEAKRLIYEAQREGAIELKANDIIDAPFDAIWYPSNRSILINPHEDLGPLICSILFELHNAKTNYAHNQLATLARLRHISRQTYIYEVERIEHQNAMATVTLIELGIARGIFPPSTRWPIPQDFQSYLITQKMSGHSEFIGRVYDEL